MKNSIVIDKKKIIAEPIAVGDGIEVISKGDSRLGLKGTILAFDEMARGRWKDLSQPYKCPPGIYENPWWCHVLFKTKNKITNPDWISTCNINVLDKTNWRIGLFFNPSIKLVRELPQTDFWELDSVKLMDGDNLSFSDLRGCNRGVIEKIHYLNWLGNKGIFYNVHIGDSPLGRDLTIEGVSPSNLSLLERGDVWRYYNAQPLKFQSSHQEKYFFDNLVKKY